MPAARIFFFARVSRFAIVGSGTRKACAICEVVRPPTDRSVSATCASRSSAGWQHPKTSANWSSMSRPCSGSRSASATSVGSRSSNRWARRIRSMALRRAVVSNHAPGRSGAPSRRHAREASTKASCADSSARSRSRSSRVNVATRRGHSVRKTASTVETAGMTVTVR